MHPAHFAEIARAQPLGPQAEARAQRQLSET